MMRVFASRFPCRGSPKSTHMRRSGQSDGMSLRQIAHQTRYVLQQTPKRPSITCRRENRVAISNRRVYAVVITRLKHRLECCPARAFAPDDQVRMHLKRMDSNHSLARRATPRRRRSLSTALERPTFSAPTTSARPKAPPGYRRVRRKRPLLFRRPQRSIGSVAKENNP